MHPGPEGPKGQCEDWGSKGSERGPGGGRGSVLRPLWLQGPNPSGRGQKPQ